MKHIVSILVALLVTVIAATMWATLKSRARTECYKTAKVVADCEQPGAVEAFVRRVLG